MSVIPALEREKQENQEFKANLKCMRSYLKKKKKSFKPGAGEMQRQADPDPYKEIKLKLTMRLLPKKTKGLAN